MSETSVLEGRNLEFSWDGRPILEDISIHVDKGEFVCLVGKSGCGKTTLFHALAGLTYPDSGQVLLDGKDISGEPGHVSYMLQKDLLLPSKKILDNICLPLVLRGVNKSEARNRARELMVRFGLDGTEDLWPHQLSGGMRQRAALLRTYLMDNEVVLLDEPFSALDAITRVDMRLWFATMLQELSMSSLMITHDVDEAVAMADRIYVMQGNPAASIPTKIGGEIKIERPDNRDTQFSLTPEFLEYKKQVLNLLN